MEHLDIFTLMLVFGIGLLCGALLFLFSLVLVSFLDDGFDGEAEEERQP